MGSKKLDGLISAVRGIAGEPAGELCDVDVEAELRALRQLADLAEAAYLARLAVFHARGIGERDGLSTRSWLRARLNVSSGEAGRAVKTAVGLAELPQTSVALAEGGVRPPHAAAIVDAAIVLGDEAIREAEQVLVRAAAETDPSRLRTALRGYGAAVDNPAAVRAAEHRDEGRWLDISTTFEGAVAVQGMLGAEDGAILRAAVGALDGLAGADDARTSAQRRADALVELCRRQLHGGELPSRGGERPHLTVVTTLATIEGRLVREKQGELDGTGLDAVRGEGSGGGFGTLPDGTVLRGETVRRLACDAKITRLIVGPASMPLDVGRSQRTVTPAQRKALRVRDGGCVFPGCARPVDWCDAHHVNFWSLGGLSDIDELVLLCRKHHTLVHEGSWRLDLVGPGIAVFVTSTGEVVRSSREPFDDALIARLLAMERSGAA